MKTIQTYYNDGQLYERKNYKDGKQNGLYQSWYYNGKLFEKSNWKNEKRHGLYEEWDKDGKQIIKQYYISDQEVTEEEWNKYNTNN